ncbi:ecto-NOX disulfide-thiol exchanger 1-like [Vanacampus margaritifer]
MTSHGSAVAAVAAAANGVAPQPAWAPPVGVMTVLPQQLMASDFLAATSLASVLTARSEAPANAPGNPSTVGPAGAGVAPATVKEIIRRNRCTLFPQNPNLPPPSTRPRPPGCKTVFVGGLPENADDDIIREVFGPCGDIIALRKSKKNFCHIRFSDEFMVDEALGLSGYRLRLGSSTDKKDSGKIHVDFAQARDDLYEWECKQRLLEREQRHQEQQDSCLHRDEASPTLTPHFSEREVAVLAECLKDKHRFSWAASVLLCWMDGGEVNRASANHVYALIQSANAHARRLRRDARQQRRTLHKAKIAFREALADILAQLDQVSSVLVASGRQKSRDHFSKAQRNNIDMWTRRCQVDSKEVSALRRQDEEEGVEEDEDDEGPFQKKMKMCGDEDGADACRPDAFEEAEHLRKEAEPQRLEAGLCLLPMQQVNGFQWSAAAAHGNRETRGGGGVLVSEKEALLLGVMSAFLHVHPFGANLEYLCSYVRSLDSQVSSGELERLMVRLPLMFRQQLSGVGATLEKRWKFCGFDSLQSG